MSDDLKSNNLPCEFSAVFNLIMKLNADSMRNFNTLLGNQNLLRVTDEYRVHCSRNFDIGLNLFTLISDQYQKENLHSDILKEVLDPNGIHKEGDKYLMLFLDYLANHSKKILLSKDDYQEAVVEREIDRIDISIKDKKSRKAIIIENKINNAPDMPRQIPRYWLELEEQGYTIEAVVYLVLNGNKQPNTFDWSKKERKVILGKVLLVSAYDETETDLFSGWLIKCECSSQYIDTVFLFRQYNKLIFQQGGKNMSKPLMEEFLTSMLDEQNYKTANAIKDMLNELPNYRRDKIIENFKYKALPFTKVSDWKNVAVIDNYIVGQNNYAIDVVITNNLYQVQFFDRHFNEKSDVFDETNPVIPLLEETTFLNEFYNSGRRMEKQFRFPEEENELYIFLTNFIAALQKRDLEVDLH